MLHTHTSHRFADLSDHEWLQQICLIWAVDESERKENFLSYEALKHMYHQANNALESKQFGVRIMIY